MSYAIEGMGDPTLVPFILQLYTITSPFSPSYRKKKEDAEAEHRRLQFLCFLIAWEGS